MTTIQNVDVGVYRIPLDPPEADGTLAWDHTTAVVAEVRAGAERGLGVTYGPGAVAGLIRELLTEPLIGLDALNVPGAWTAMTQSVRNAGRPGIASMAIAALELALWDTKAKLLEVPLFQLLGAARERVPVYASGGFTSMDDEALTRQLFGWVNERGFSRVKMKIGVDGGSDPGRDIDRVAMVRKAIGSDAELFVDANGAYSRKTAIRVGRSLAGEGVTWFEEPVSSDDLEGLREVREGIDAEVAAGEYGYTVFDFQRLVSAVDVLQADVSRCGGIHGWFRASALAAANSLELSGHTAQSMHLHVACAIPNLRHLEYFADHERVDRLLFDGVVSPREGVLRPDQGRPGHGLTLRRADAERYREE
jgi:L-alanine-DL-glutamate epimerase-like enolase superfamily enzyme